jgi:hypothetical protein
VFVIRDKKSKAILHMWQSVPGERRKPEELLPDFDSKTMEFGRTDALFVPASFDIENGVIKPLEPPAPEVEAAPAAPAPSLAQVKETTLAELSRLSFELRKKLIPDHELQNAALGVYDEKRTQAIRDTVKAFRDEYKRLEAVLKKARSIKEVQALKPDFPTQVAAAVSSASRKGEKEKR